MTLSFRPSSIVVRVFLVFGLVFSTFNPSGYSYFHWVMDIDSGQLLLKLAVGLGLAFCYWIVFSITCLALGVTGGLLLLFLLIFSVGALWQLDIWPFNTLSWIIAVLSMVAVYFSVGVVYSPLRHRLSGQVQSLALSGR